MFLHQHDIGPKMAYKRDNVAFMPQWSPKGEEW